MQAPFSPAVECPAGSGPNALRPTRPGYSISIPEETFAKTADSVASLTSGRESSKGFSDGGAPAITSVDRMAFLLLEASSRAPSLRGRCVL